jgi:hypothetical protein
MVKPVGQVLGAALVLLGLASFGPAVKAAML